MKLADKRLLAVMLGLAVSGCGRGWNKTLPNSAELGSPRGYRLARTIMHLHSPLSYDACDGKGSIDLSQNAACLAHLREGLCLNRVDFAFLTDHPNHMSEVDFESLLLHQEGDTWQELSGARIASQWACTAPESRSVVVTAGYEDRLMAMGMQKHYGTTVGDRGIYLGENASTVTSLKTDTQALVTVPHIESRELSLLESLGADALEVYNFHSNLDPKIRSTYLGLSELGYLFDLMNYWLDPYYRQEADLALFSFFEMSDVILQKWQSTWHDGYTPSSFAGTDSHENALPMVAPDGDRLDAHRRLIRWVSNHWLVKELSLSAVKEAIQKGRGWFAVEGWGSPVGFDFTATRVTPEKDADTTKETVAGVGESLKMKNFQVKLRAELPSLHSQSPGSGITPRRRVLIRKITGAESEIVAEAINESAEITIKDAGIYRAEVQITPSHLKGSLYYDVSKADQEFLWVFSNPIKLLWEAP